MIIIILCWHRKHPLLFFNIKWPGKQGFLWWKNVKEKNVSKICFMILFMHMHIKFMSYKSTCRLVYIKAIVSISEIKLFILSNGRYIVLYIIEFNIFLVGKSYKVKIGTNITSTSMKFYNIMRLHADEI